jgi:hypothetical protein
MPRFSTVSWFLLTIGSGSLGLTLGACDAGDSTPTGTAGTSASGGSLSGTSGSAGSSGGSPSGTAGNAGSSAASGSASGGAGTGGTGQAGSASAGAAGTGTGGSGTAGSAGTAGSTAGGAGNCSGALFCDDFEAYTDVPGAPWKVLKNQGNVSIDTTKHNSGTKAAKFTTTGAAAYQQAFISYDKVFPLAQNAFYGRMMIYATSAANDGVHWTMIQGEGVAAGGITRAVVRYGGQQQKHLMANYDSSGKKSDCWRHSATVMPEGKWACMEWYFDGATNTQKFWLDGTAITDLTVMGQGDGCLSDETGNQWVFPTFANFSVGWESYQTDPAREVWIDDVAIGATQLGCPK